MSRPQSEALDTATDVGLREKRETVLPQPTRLDEYAQGGAVRVSDVWRNEG